MALPGLFSGRDEPGEHAVVGLTIKSVIGGGDDPASQ